MRSAYWIFGVTVGDFAVATAHGRAVDVESFRVVPYTMIYIRDLFERLGLLVLLIRGSCEVVFPFLD